MCLLNVKIISKKCVWIFLLLCMFLESYDTLPSDFEPGGKPQTKILSPGAEAVIGAIVNVRIRGPGLFGCGERRLEGVATVDALSWAVDDLNRQIWSGSSSNVSLGLHVMDSCGRTRTAATQLIDFLPELREDGGAVKESTPLKLGLIDDVGLDQEIDVTKALDDLGVSVVRTDVQTRSPEDIVKTASALIQELRWEHLAIVHSSSRFSLSMLKMFTKALKKLDLCVPWIVNVEEDKKELESIFNSGIPVISLLPSEEHVLLNLEIASKKNRKSPILFTDLVFREDLRLMSENAIQVLAMVPMPMKEVRFEEYLSQKSIMTGVRTEDELELALRTRVVRKTKKIVQTLSSVLAETIREVCGNEKSGLCRDMLTLDGRKTFADSLSKADWTSAGLLYGLVEYQYQFPNGHVHLRKVMSYNIHNNLDVFEPNLHFATVSCEEGSDDIKPECHCLEFKNVRTGSARNIDDRGSRIQQHTIHGIETEFVSPSPPEIRPADHTPVTPSVYMPLRDPLNAALGGLTLFGALLTLFTAQYFATFAAMPRGGLSSGTSIIGYFILIGLFLLYSTNLSFLLTPSVSSCGIRRFGPNFCYAMIFSGMMIKVWTSWKQGKSEKKETSKPLTLVLLSMAFSIIQGLLSGTWLMLVPPKSYFDLEKWSCYPSADLDSHLLVSMIYIVGLLFATAFLAIRACSQNNNSEARWILISSALVAIIFSCWGIAVATGVWISQRTPSMNLAAATILLLCLYIPKIKSHSRLKRTQPEVAQFPVEFDKEYSLFAARPPFPVMLDYNMASPVASEDLTESGYSNQAYSMDGGTESMSIPFEIDNSSYSEPEHEPITFSTFLNDPQATQRSSQSSFVNDPTQVVPSSLYSLEMFDNEADAAEAEHYQPGTNEFTPAHRTASQMYLCPPPEWVP